MPSISSEPEYVAARLTDVLAAGFIRLIVIGCQHVNEHPEALAQVRLAVRETLMEMHLENDDEGGS